MTINRTALLLLAIQYLFTSVCTADEPSPSSYVEHNRGTVSFDVSMPIDATGFTLQGKNLKGGDVQFINRGSFIAPRLAHEVGEVRLPVVTSPDGKPLITTKFDYQAVKFIDPIGIDNFFIKVGMANRTQTVDGLDPKVLKDGTYTWRVPIFAAGKESDTVDGQSSNYQFMQVGMTGGPASSNVEYTQEFYLYSQADGDTPIPGHPVRTVREGDILPKARTAFFTGHADGLWGGGGADPYRTVTGQFTGSTTTFPGGPHLDYEYGTLQLPTVQTPWSASPDDHGLFEGKRVPGIVNARIDSEINYTGQKMRVPLNENVNVYAVSGSMYRKLITDNLRYVCGSNVYLKNILPPDDCLKKSYLPGGYAAPFFAVGYEIQRGPTLFSARYIYLPGAENSNRLAWRDASDTEIYAVSASGEENVSQPSTEEITKALNDGLDEIREVPGLYELLGQQFFTEILEKNGM